MSGDLVPKYAILWERLFPFISCNFRFASNYERPLMLLAPQFMALAELWIFSSVGLPQLNEKEFRRIDSEQTGECNG
jgi:hypothetical protein